MKTKYNRLCIYPKDVVKVTGRTERFSRSLIQRIKQNLNKKPHQFVSVEEFCEYTGLEIEKVQEIIKD